MSDNDSKCPACVCTINAGNYKCNSNASTGDNVLNNFNQICKLASLESSLIIDLKRDDRRDKSGLLGFIGLCALCTWLRLSHCVSMSDEKVSQTEEEQRRQNAQSNCAQAHVATGNAILRVHAPSGSPLHHYTAANANANV